MPDLSVFRDVDEVENRYIDKCVVYVEGKDDRNVWQKVMGGEFADRIEFKVPVAEGTGSETVLNRVCAERPRNPKIFGLVDGEVAARFGEADRLIDCSDVLFRIRASRCDGVLFLAAHEMENIVVGHSNFAGFVETNVRIREMGTISFEEVDHHIRVQATRFYVAALIKYAWAHLYSRGQATGIGNVDHFRSDNGLLAEIRNAKRRIRQEFADQAIEFRRQFDEIKGWAKTRMNALKRNGESTDVEVVRLADGKGLLIKLQQRWGIAKANEGLLVERVCTSDFPEKFRLELVKATGA